MSTRLSAGRVRAAYEFIKAHRDRYSVWTPCRLLDVAPSGYYKWLNEPLSNHAQQDARVLRLIRTSFVASQGIHGARCSTSALVQRRWPSIAYWINSRASTAPT